MSSLTLSNLRLWLSIVLEVRIYLERFDLLGLLSLDHVTTFTEVLIYFIVKK